MTDNRCLDPVAERRFQSATSVLQAIGLSDAAVSIFVDVAPRGTG